MAAGRYRSRVFEAGTKLYEALDSVAFPAHPTTGRVPVVEFSDEDPGSGAETVCIVANPDETTIDWGRVSPSGRDETIVFEVVARSFVPNVRASQTVWDRLEELCGPIEDALYDRDTEKPTVLGFTGEIMLGLVAGVQPSVFPTDQGWFGTCTITVRLEARI